MNPSMNNTYRTTDQSWQNGLPSIRSSFVHHPSTIFDGFNESPNPQGYENYVANNNDKIDNSSHMDLLTNDPSGSHIYPTNTNERQSDIPPMVFTQQPDPTQSKQIEIKFQPRRKYHPRTQKENIKVAHYIRCEEEEAEYPTIRVFPFWYSPSKKIFIEVALIAMDYQLHPYSIDNKKRNLPADQQSIFRVGDAGNILCFHVTDEDSYNGCKSFEIQLIKSKQNDTITKKLIRERELEKSMLRFTRTYYDEHGVYQRDEDSTAYSCVMTESYPIAVKSINPQYGPMNGNQLLNVVMTCFTAKNKGKLSFEIFEQTTNWKSKITNFDLIGNIIQFPMPAFSHPTNDNNLTSVMIYYEGEAIFESPYLYIAGLDQILNTFNLNNPTKVDADLTIPNSDYDSDQDVADNSYSSSLIPKKRPKKRFKKTSV